VRVSRMSSAGHCIRQLYCEEMKIPGEPRPTWLDESAEEGVEQEVSVKNRLRKEGYKVEECLECPTCKAKGLLRAGIHVETELSGVLFVGHLDGTVIPPVTPLDTPDLLEVKTMSFFQFRRWKNGGFSEFPDYGSQLALYFKATGLPRALFCVKDRNNGHFEKNPVYATEFQGLAEEIGERHAILDICIEQEDMPRAFFNASYECKWCLWRKLCAPEPVKLAEDVVKELTEASENWRQSVVLLRQGKELQDLAKEKFLASSKAASRKKWIFGGLSINHISVRENTQYPKKKLLEVFTPEQLELAAEKKEAYEFIKIEEVEK
jgi:hypothetical protein